MRTGIDAVETARIEKSLMIPGFRERVYSPREIEFIEAKGSGSVQSYAANFAAKEAFSKSIGTGIRGFSLTEVEILRNALGAPYIVLSGKAAELAKGLGFTVSLTHTRRDATAIVIAFEENER